MKGVRLNLTCQPYRGMNFLDFIVSAQILTVFNKKNGGFHIAKQFLFAHLDFRFVDPILAAKTGFAVIRGVCRMYLTGCP